MAEPPPENADVGREPFERRLRRLAEPVSRFWGVSMPVVAGDGPPATNWTSVTIPTDSAQDADDEITSLLLHEWGHRTLSPVSVARGYWWALVARLEGIRAAHEAVNIATDLVIDHWYMHHPLWGAMYATCERERFVKQLKDPVGQRAVAQDPVHRLLVSCYAQMEGWQAALGDLSVDLPLAARAVAALLDEARPQDERMRRFFRTVAPVFLALPRGTVAPHGGGRRAKGPGVGPAPRLRGAPCPWRTVTWDANELVRLLASSGLPVPASVLGDVCGRQIAGRVRARLRVLESLVRTETHLKHLESRLRAERHEGATIWRVGDSIRALEPIMSLERSGVLLPGVTTLRRRYFRAQQEEPGLHSVCLVVDNSGSTQGAVIQRELDAAVALLEASRRLGALASTVVFGSDVVARVEPGREYDHIGMLLAGLEGQSGGTNLAPALREAVRFRPVPGRKMGTIVFTDSYICDEAPAVAQIQTLMELGPVVLFCVETRLDEGFLALVRRLRVPPRIVQFRPGQPLVDAALQVFEAPDQTRGRRTQA